MVAREPLRCLLAVASASTASARQPAARHLAAASTRHLHSGATKPSIPEPIPFCPDTQTFLTLIGRDLSQHASKIETWQNLFSLTSAQFKELGIEPARSRKYLLRWLDKYRHGEFGLGGDLQHVKDGVAYVRLCEVPADSEIAAKAWVAKHGEGDKSDGLLPPTSADISATITRSAGMRQVVLNIPVETQSSSEGSSSAATPADAEADAEPQTEDPTPSTSPLASVLTAPLTPTQLSTAVPVRGFKRQGISRIFAAHVQPVKGTQGKVVKVQVKEGMWEHIRGHKIDGGERRKAMVRYNRRMEERKKAG